MASFADTPTLSGTLAILEPLSPDFADELGWVSEDAIVARAGAVR